MADEIMGDPVGLDGPLPRGGRDGRRGHHLRQVPPTRRAAAVGGILVLSVGFSRLLAYPDFQHQTRMWAFMASWATMVLARTLLLASLILLVGGLVRWGLARMAARADA